MLLTDFFIALAVSTMVGDAFFHILPHMLGLHSHDHEEKGFLVEMTLNGQPSIAV